jgi:S-adenosylmethionine:tRNA ribosyltransferase-isomerase
MSLAFTLPRELEAAAPAAQRDQVRMLVSAPGAPLVHAGFRDLPDHLAPGDLLVVNRSATLPAALPAERGGGAPLRLHLSTPLPPPRPQPWPDDGRERWVVELRDGDAPFRGGRAGERLELPAGASAELLAPYQGGARLWAARLTLPEPLLAYLDRHGEPIRYRHAPEPRPLADHQTIFAAEPGSAEMPSAGRPFTRRVLNALGARGIGVAEVVLHTGVSSLERGERPYPERFRVPEATAAAVAAANRVIAVGTTVVRALESAAGEAAEGWTRLVVTPERGVRWVDGILTGWHEPDASHLLMLEAIAGPAEVRRSYAAALSAGYRWHEFGDVHMLFAGGPQRRALERLGEQHLLGEDQV